MEGFIAAQQLNTLHMHSRGKFHSARCPYKRGLFSLSLLRRSRGFVSEEWCPPMSLNSLYSAFASALSAAAAASVFITCFTRFTFTCSAGAAV